MKKLLSKVLDWFLFSFIPVFVFIISLPFIIYKFNKIKKELGE